MAVTQYIGSRYVPIFADPIEWSSQNTYEPLTIVIHAGNSYTAKQAVPKGIDIANEAFWALTGNYNAQIELYRRETAEAQETAESAQTDIDELLPKTAFTSSNTVKSYIDSHVTQISDVIPVSEFDSENTVKNYIDTSIANYNKSYVGSYGATPETSGINWNSIIAAISAVSDTIYFGNEKWDVGSGIDIPSRIKNVFGAGATLYTSSNSNPDFLINVNAITHISGINFRGDGKVTKLLASNDTTAGNRLQVDNCKFLNVGHGNYGIYNGRIGLMCNACFFYNEDDYIGGTAIQSHTDNIVNGCKFFRFDFDVAVFGVNCNNCYFWHTDATEGVVFAPEFWNNRTSYNENVNQSYDIIATNCEFDCVKKLVINPRNVIIFNNQFYWNNRDLSSNTNVKLFYNSGTYVGAPSIEFSYNVFKFQEILCQIYMFGSYADESGATTNAMQLRNYHSINNRYTSDVYNLNAIDRYHLLCGWASDNFMKSTSNNYWSHLQTFVNRTNSQQAIFFKSNENFWEYDVVNGTHQMTFKNVTARQDVARVQRAYYEPSGNFEMYFTCLPFTFNEITVRSGAPLMFDMTNTAMAENPDVTDMTEVVGQKLSLTNI